MPGRSGTARSPVRSDPPSPGRSPRRSVQGPVRRSFRGPPRAASRLWRGPCPAETHPPRPRNGAGSSRADTIRRAARTGLRPGPPQTTRNPVGPPAVRLRPASPRGRSEEHTSELQSQSNLVCRLLLEKKNSQQLTSARTYFSVNTGPPSVTTQIDPANVPTSASVFSVDRNQKIDYVHQFQISYQWQFSRDWSLDIGYVGNRSRNLLTTFNIGSGGTAPAKNASGGFI